MFNKLYWCFSYLGLMVLAASAALSTPFWNVLGEPLDRRTLGVKLASTVLIVGGVVALTLA